MDMGCREEGSRNRNTKGDSSEGRVGRSVGELETERERETHMRSVPHPSVSRSVHVCVCVSANRLRMPSFPDMLLDQNGEVIFLML